MDDNPKELPITEVGRDEIFLLFALGECARALDSIERIERLASVRVTDEARQVEVREWISIFDAIRMALHFTGSVSRTFFPIWRGGKHEQSSDIARSRAERLRALAGIADDHPIKERALRDDVEHMDERLDAWIGGPRRPYMSVEAVISEDLPEVTRNACERSSPFLYYEATREVSVFGNRTSLDEWREVLIDVRTRISSGFSELIREAKLEGRQTLT